jgi:hypothetical protein
LCASPSAVTPIDFAHCTGSAVKAVDPVGNVITFGWGSTPSISASDQNASDAIVWALVKPDTAVESGVQGILYAIDAVSMTQLYTSANNGCSGDAINPATKFSVPTVANGYVYLGTESSNTQQTLGMGTFYIFGPNRPLTC